MQTWHKFEFSFFFKWRFVLEANLVFMVNSLCWKYLFIFRFDVCTYSPALEHSLQNVWSKFGIYGKLFWWSCLLFIFRFDIRTASLALEYFLKTSIAETGVDWEYKWVWTETFCFWTHTSYLSQTPLSVSVLKKLPGVNFYRFNAKNWQFTV